jgi:hypothetical protein
MTKTKRHRSRMQQELTGYLGGVDVMEWVHERRTTYGNTWPEIAKMLSESGWVISPMTVQRWDYSERNRR